MQFRTQIPIQRAYFPMDYTSKIWSIGSCFAASMSKKLDYFKFQNSANPYGIIFNAVSIERLLHRIVHDEIFGKHDVFYQNDLWHCFEVHSQCSHSDKTILLANLNAILRTTKIFLSQASHVIITYGTSWVYRDVETNKVVANCHKLPQNRFQKELLSAESTSKAIENTLSLLQLLNPEVVVVFTVSPVRHIKDGFMENNVSKGVLLQSLYHCLISKNKTARVGYFPSYEIIMDELRDYRFFEADMLHPNQVAVDYIWEQFFSTNFSKTIVETMNEVCTIQKMMQHRPVNPATAENQKLQSKIIAKIQKIKEKHPELVF